MTLFVCRLATLDYVKLSPYCIKAENLTKLKNMRFKHLNHGNSEEIDL